MLVKPKKTKKRIILIILAFLILLSIGGYVYYYQSQRNKESTNQTIKDPINSTVERTIQNDNKTTIQNEPTDTASKTQLTITYVNQNENTLHIRTLINSLWANGQCTLSLTKDSVEVKETVNIEALPSSSTCQGFDIPISKLSIGTWHTKIVANQNSDTATAEQDVDIK